MSRDPIGEEGGNNLYLSVNNNPVSFVDAHGLAVHLSPGNGRAHNVSAKESVTIKGDWIEIEETASGVIHRPWLGVNKVWIKLTLTLSGIAFTESIGSGSHSLGPTKWMENEWTAGNTYIVDSDHLTGATKPVHKDKKCKKKATLPIKIGWHTLIVHDCPCPDDGLWYSVF